MSSFSTSFNVGFLIQNNSYGVSLIPAILKPGSYQTSDINIKIFPVWYKQISLEWSVPSSWGSCMFNVYFAPTQDGPWELITPTPIRGTFLTENLSQEYSKFDKGYYIVETILLDKNSVSVVSPPITWLTFQSSWVNLRAMEIQRRFYILSDRFTGINSYLFRSKTYGERCPNCWDYKTEKVIKDHCNICFGTSFNGGYFDPVNFKLQYEPTPNKDQMTYFGKFEDNQIGARTISIPEIRLNDVIIRTGDWNAYRVDNVATTELQGNTVSQIILLTQLAKTSIEYKLITKNVPDFPRLFL